VCRLADDAHDLPDTPARFVADAIDDLRKQVYAARLAARDYREREHDIVQSLRRTEEDPT